MIELMVAAALGSSPKRAFRNGAPQSPVKVMIGPTMPPCAIRISHVLLKEKTLRRLLKIPLSVALSCFCNSGGA